MIQPFIWGRPYTPFECFLSRHNTPRLSLAYFCPHCGEVWARFIAPGRSWQVLTRNCDRCGIPNTLTPAGSVLLPYDPYFYKAFPVDILRREAILHGELYAHNPNHFSFCS